MPDVARPKFLYYGHSTVGVQLLDGQTVLIDPWVEGNPMCPESLYEFDKIDAFLITHAHMDHMGDAVELARRHQPKKVVASFEICNWLGSKGVENLAPMGLGGSQNVLGLEVTMVRADHSSGIIEDAGEQPGGEIFDGGVASGYCVRTAEGFCFYHAGDTAVFSDMKLIAELYRPTLGFVPVGDLFTMGPREAALACKFLGLEQAVPIHFGTFPVLTGTPAEFRSQVATLGIDCSVVELAPGDTL
ncbi:MAG: metal-dependent hydrolase [bacterium]|nr:metal-dependent hydrolase [bacterium]